MRTTIDLPDQLAQEAKLRTAHLASLALTQAADWRRRIEVSPASLVLTGSIRPSEAGTGTHEGAGRRRDG